jgi:sec-independent protein translocase protein TatC
MSNGLLSTFLGHIMELRTRLLYIGVTFMIFFAIAIMFRLDFVNIGGIPVPYLYPDIFNSIAIQLFRWLVNNTAPLALATPAVFGPTEGIMVEMKIAMFLALAMSMPMIVYQLGKFLAPALRPKEKKLLIRTAVPASILFVTGAVFAYVVVLEFMFDFLYQIGLSMVTYVDPVTGQVVTVAYMSVEQFIDFTLMILLAFGLAFELPVIMVGLSAIGLVSPAFWKRNWRYATAAIFFFGAFITPDGSGVTMLLVALPMLFLYVGGYFVSKRVVSRRKRKLGIKD